MSIERLLLLSAAMILTYGAVSDARKHIIPDGVPMALIALGCIGMIAVSPGELLYISINERMAGALIPAITLFTIYHFDKRIGGGDFKLLAAMGFCFGIYGLVPILFIATITAVAWSVMAKQKNVPLAVFMALGLLTYILCEWGGHKL